MTYLLFLLIIHLLIFLFFTFSQMIKLLIFFISIFSFTSITHWNYYQTELNWFNITASSWSINYENLYKTWSIKVNNIIKFLWVQDNFLYYLVNENSSLQLRNCYTWYVINNHVLSCRSQQTKYNTTLNYSTSLDDLSIIRTNTWIIVDSSNNEKIKLFQIENKNIYFFKKSLIDVLIYISFVFLFLFTLISFSIKIFKSWTK